MKIAGAAILGTILAIAVSNAVPSAQQPTFSQRVEAVRLDVLVADGGRPVAGLTARDFEVLDNGVPQRLDSVSVDTLPLNLILTLDRSASVVGEALARLRDASRLALQGLRAGDRAALLTFGDSLSLGSPLTDDYERVRRGLVAELAAGQGTALIDAAYATMWLSEGDPGRTLAIVFSDGVDTASWLRPDRILDGARRADIVIYAVTTGDAGERAFITQLSETTGGRVFALDSAKGLGSAFAGILEEFRQRYIIGYTPERVTRGGWHKLEVRVRNRRVKVTARTGYLSGPS